MSPFEGSGAPPPFEDSVYAAALLAIDPGLGGILLRSRFGPARDSWLRRLSQLRPTAVVKKMPLNISADRFSGGLDLAATLATGRKVERAGILAEAAGGFLLLAMAERLEPRTVAQLASVVDGGADVALVALDEGYGADEIVSASLRDRLAFTVEALPDEAAAWPDDTAITAATARFQNIAAGAEIFETLCAMAALLGVSSARAEIFCARAARAAAALRGAPSITQADVDLAVRLVFFPRATQLPQQAPPPTPPGDAAETPSPGAETAEDKVTAAADAILPAAILSGLSARPGPRRRAPGSGAGGDSETLRRGRPVGVRPGRPQGDARLSVLETLRAAVPWQRLRPSGPGRIAVRGEDLRLRRFKERPRRLAIFAVDASGSSAVNRLAEAKGAILRLLADCYVARDEVALIAFRGVGAEVLLPPTHALARVRRALAVLPGGGATPLATGIDAAARLAAAQISRGKQPLIVLLTDGGANIGKDGRPGRAAAGRDALAAARACAAAGILGLVVDIAPRRTAFVAQISAAMQARYLPLPYADATRLSRAVQDAGGFHARFA